MTAQAGAAAPLLEALPATARAAVLAAGQRRTFARGETIVRQGDDATSMHLIESGRVTARLVSASGDLVTLSVMGAGEVFGELGVVLAHHERTATAEALGAVAVRVWHRDAVDRLRADHPSVNDLMLQVLARRVERLSRRLLEAHHVSVERRVARRLLEVGRLFVADGLPVVLPLTQEDVGHLAGTTRPTANQVLKRLEADEIVRLVRGRVELVDVAGLRERCR